MNNTLTLVGRAPEDRERITSLPADARIFTIAACHDLPPHIDACIEIHKYWLLSDKNYAPHLWEWMQQPHDFPMLMQEAFEDVPGADVFPLDDVVNLAPILRGDDDRPTAVLSSSFDFLMAYAIMQQPKRINILGYAMSSDTEYKYQRPGAAYWLGVAAGRGIEVWLSDDCPLMAADMIYGYEGAQAIKFERLDELSVKAQAWIKEGMERYQQLMSVLPDVDTLEPSEAMQAQYQTASDARDYLFVCDGVRQAIEQLRENFSIGDIVSRQQLEAQRTTSVNQAQYHISRLNFWEGYVSSKQTEYNAAPPEKQAELMAELHEAHAQSNEVRDHFFRWKGAMQLINQLVNECDFKYDPDWEPKADTVQEVVTARSEDDIIE